MCLFNVLIVHSLPPLRLPSRHTMQALNVILNILVATFQETKKKQVKFILIAHRIEPNMPQMLSLQRLINIQK